MKLKIDFNTLLYLNNYRQIRLERETSMFSEREQKNIEIYEESGRRKEIDDVEFLPYPLVVNTFARVRGKGEIIDVGCGHGRLVPILGDLGILRENYLGVDPALAQVELGRELHPNVKFEVGDFYSIGETYPARFDGFFSNFVLMHIPKNRLNEALSSLRACVKFNAVGILTTLFGEDILYDKDGMEFVRYTGEELQEALSSAGFRSTHHRPVPEVLMLSIVAA